MTCGYGNCGPTCEWQCPPTQLCIQPPFFCVSMPGPVIHCDTAPCEVYCTSPGGSYGGYCNGWGGYGYGNCGGYGYGNCGGYGYGNCGGYGYGRCGWGNGCGSYYGRYGWGNGCGSGYGRCGWGNGCGFGGW